MTRSGSREAGIAATACLELQASAHRLSQVVREGQADARRSVAGHAFFKDVGGEALVDAFSLIADLDDHAALG